MGKHRARDDDGSHRQENSAPAKDTGHQPKHDPKTAGTDVPSRDSGEATPGSSRLRWPGSSRN